MAKSIAVAADGRVKKTITQELTFSIKELKEQKAQLQSRRALFKVKLDQIDAQIADLQEDIDLAKANGAIE